MQLILSTLMSCELYKMYRYKILYLTEYDIYKINYIRNVRQSISQKNKQRKV